MADDVPRVPTSWDRSTGRKLAIAAVVIGVLGAGIAAERLKARRDHQREEWQRAGTEWFQLNRCLLGDRPLAMAETPGQRLRATFLAIRSLNRGVPPTDQGSTSWPERCSPHKTALAVAVREAGPTPERDGLVASLSAELDLATPEGVAAAERLFSLGQALAFPKPSRTLEVQVPPAVHPPLRSVELPAIADQRARLLGSRGVQTPAPWILLGAESAPHTTLCGFAEGLKTMTCAPARGKNPSHLLVSEGASPTLLADGAKGEERVIDARTGEARGPYVRSGYVRADGSYVGIEPMDKDRGELILVRDGKVVTRSKQDDPGVHSEVLGRWLVQQQRGKGLRVSALSAEGTPSGEAAVILGDSVRAVCMVGPRAALVTEQVPAIGPATVTVSFERDGGWSTPVTGEMGRMFSSVSCGDGWVSVVWPDTDHSNGAPFHTIVHRTHCTERGCSSRATPGPTTGASEAPVVHAVDLGRAVAVLWGRAAQPLRMMVAPIERLASTADVVVSDQHAFGGIGDEALEILGVVAGEGAAAVLVRNQEKTMAIRIADDGSFSRIPTEP